MLRVKGISKPPLNSHVGVLAADYRLCYQSVVVYVLFITIVAVVSDDRGEVV